MAHVTKMKGTIKQQHFPLEIDSLQLKRPCMFNTVTTAKNDDLVNGSLYTSFHKFHSL